MKYTIGSYRVEKFSNGDVRIHYKRSSKDLFYILVYFILSLPILVFVFKFISHLIHKAINFNTIIGYLFSLFLLLTGLYFLAVSIETLLKPTSNVFVIDSLGKFKIRLNLWKKMEFNFDEIKRFNIKAEDITMVSYHESRKFKRPLYLIQMNLELLNNKEIKIHQFEGADLLLSLNQKKKNQSLKEVSRQITHIVAKGCEKEFYWNGTERE